MRKIKIKNKKAQIGPTLTWIVAAFIIFFILIIFLAAALFLSLKKDEIKVIKKNENKIDLVSAKTLMFVMNLPAEFKGEQIEVRELIVNWSLADVKGKEEIKDKIKEEAGSVLEKTVQEDECYVFNAEYGLENLEDAGQILAGYEGYGGQYKAELIESRTIEFDNLLSVKDPRVSKYTEQLRENLLNKAPEIFIFSDKEKIKVKLYAGKC